MPRVVDPEEPEGFNLTPMIDVTFQLIIFFMLVTDMSRHQIEKLTLPSASQAVTERFSDESTLVLNVLKDGTVMVQGKAFFRPPAAGMAYDPKMLENLFAARRQDKRYQELAGRSEHVKYPLLVRADRSTPWQWVQMIMQIAAKEGGVTRVQMGATQEEGR